MNTVGWEEDIWLPSPIKHVVRKAIADNAWERLRLGRISLQIGNDGEEQFKYPIATLSSQGLIYVADFANTRIQVFNPDGSSLLIHWPFKFPRSLSPDGPDRIVACCTKRTAFDLSSNRPAPTRRHLNGDWPGDATFATVLDDGSLLVLAFNIIAHASRYTLERFTRDSDSEWIHQPNASILLPESRVAAVTFACDPTTDRVWWGYSNARDFICVLNLSSTQLLQKEIGIKLFNFSARPDACGHILAHGRDHKVYRFAQDGTLLDQCDPSLGALYSISTVPESGGIILTTDARVFVF